MDATKLAIEALRKQIRTICIDANLFDRGMADYPYAQHCSKKKKELLAAIAVLEGKKSPSVPKSGDPAQLELFK
jgi:hypothetical protein